MKRIYIRLLPYMPMVILACAAIVALWHIAIHW